MNSSENLATDKSLKSVEPKVFTRVVYNSNCDKNVVQGLLVRGSHSR